MTGLERLRELANGVFGNVWSHTLYDYCEAHGLDVENQGAKFRDELNGIATQIEREQVEVDAWVREHGGIEELRRMFKDAEIRRFELCGALGIDLDKGWSEAMAAMRLRLMPEGYEWPAFEDGEPVRLGDEYADTFGANTVATIEFGDGYSAINSNTPGGYVVGKFEGAHGRYVPRPAPKVLDADGVEIRVGDTVYGFAGQQYEVTGLCEYESSIVHAKTVGDGVAADELLALSGQLNSAQLEASKITHRALVLAADGKPLREGETVWDVDGCGPLIVWRLPDKPGMNVSLKKNGVHWYRLPKKLTHEYPDSWERLEEDVAGASCPDVYCSNHQIDASDASYEWAMARDIVRRAKKLAERDR